MSRTPFSALVGKPRQLVWLSWNAGLLAAVVVLALAYDRERSENQALRNVFAAVNESLADHNRRMAATFISEVRREVETGTPDNLYLINAAYDLLAAVDSAEVLSTQQRHELGLRYLEAYVDSLFRAMSRVPRPREVMVAHATSREATQLRIQQVTHNALQHLKFQSARLLAVPDTLTALVEAYARAARPGDTLRLNLLPYWSASGFHPFKTYAFSASIGKLDLLPDAEAARWFLPIPDTLTVPDTGRVMQVEVRIRQQRPAGYRPEWRSSQRFRILPPCPELPAQHNRE